MHSRSKVHDASHRGSAAVGPGTPAPCSGGRGRSRPGLTLSPGPRRPDDDAAADEISDSASSLWDTAVDAVPRVLTALVIVAVGWLASRAIRWALHHFWERKQTPSFAKVMSKVVGRIVLTIIVLLAIAVTFPSVKPVDILAGLGFFSVAVGFAFQDILEKTLSGVLLLFRQPFRTGDQITVMDRSGTVEGITIRETRLITYDGELVVIPNRDVDKNVIDVHTYRTSHRMQFIVGIAYENDAAEDTPAGSVKQPSN